VRTVTILACGERLRGDDGLADAVLEHVPRTMRGMLEVRRVGQLTPDHLVGAGGPVIILDAVEGPPAGKIVDLPLGSVAAGRMAGLRAASSHGVPLPIALGVVEQLLGRLPEGRFIGIGGANYALGAPLSDAVRAAVPRCASRLRHWARVLAQPTEQPTCA
jgi:hydrogenase maturation protease